jgi:hypothetical protein
VAGDTLTPHPSRRTTFADARFTEPLDESLLRPANLTVTCSCSSTVHDPSVD